MAVSAGNAGMAAAHAATRLGMPVTVCVPAATSQIVIERLRREGAEVWVGAIFSNSYVNVTKINATYTMNFQYKIHVLIYSRIFIYTR